MPKLGLRPFAVIEEGAESYLGYNFTRLENVHEQMTDVRAGVKLVTGSAIIETGLANLDGVVANLSTDAQAGAAYVSAFVSSGSAITVRVLTSGFALSVIAVNVNWIAVGELILT